MSLSWKHLRIAVNSSVGYHYMRFMGKTTRIAEWEKNPDNLKLKQRIYAIWHGRHIFAAYAYRNRNICSLSSSSEASRVIVKIIARMGYTSVFGSSSRQPVRALIRVKRKIEEGDSIIITPDGPRGPYHKVKPGVLYLAQKTGVPIIPVGCSVRDKIVVRSWDQFHFPLPFNRAVILEEPPFYMEKGDDLDRKAEELEVILNEVTKRADLLMRNASV